MSEEEVVAILKKHGWTCESDEVGDKFCSMNLGDRVVCVFPTVGRRSDHFRVTFMPSVSTVEFSEAASFIVNGGMKNGYIVVSNDPPEKVSSFTYDDVLRFSEKAIAWARSQDIGAGLAAYRNMATDAKGSMPLRHLAALAVIGDVARLEKYKNCFDRGDRLGFVPYINSDMINRAINLAKQHNS